MAIVTSCLLIDINIVDIDFGEFDRYQHHSLLMSILTLVSIKVNVNISLYQIGRYIFSIIDFNRCIVLDMRYNFDQKHTPALKRKLKHFMSTVLSLENLV